MRAMPDEQAAALLDKAKQDPNWKEVPVKQENYRIGTNEWFRNMINKVL
jgi:hypothetical protein